MSVVLVNLILVVNEVINMTQTKFPKKLQHYLMEQVHEGSTIIPTFGNDSYMFVIRPKDLKDFIVLIEWYEGEENFSMVNISGKVFHVLNQQLNS